MGPVRGENSTVQNQMSTFNNTNGSIMEDYLNQGLHNTSQQTEKKPQNMEQLITADDDDKLFTLNPVEENSHRNTQTFLQGKLSPQLKTSYNKSKKIKNSYIHARRASEATYY